MRQTVLHMLSMVFFLQHRRLHPSLMVRVLLSPIRRYTIWSRRYTIWSRRPRGPVIYTIWSRRYTIWSRRPLIARYRVTTPVLILEPP